MYYIKKCSPATHICYIERLVKKAIKNINTCLSIYLSPAECEDLHKRMLATTCRSKSEYARKVLFGKPLRTLIRNESIDKMIEELVYLRNCLAKLADIACLNEAERWYLSYRVREIKEKINQLADHVCKSKL
jgi:hypothetical protein